MTDDRPVNPRNTPVALICFNRPILTAQTFERIAQFGPKTLFIICDGPRPARIGEADLCRQVRSIVTQPSWKCDLVTNISERNLGCRERVSSGISWVFDQVEEAIILEDDCLPDPSFFRFCAELLGHYRDDERIMTISGNNFQAGRLTSPYSYYFSRYTHIWGWASWRRAWRHYDVSMSLWPAVKSRDLLFNALKDRREVRHWSRLFEMTYQHEIDTWDYQWMFASWMQSGLTVLPERNLVSNIGFGSGATHTTVSTVDANLPALQMDFPLRHPQYVLRNRKADERSARDSLTLPARVRQKLMRIVQQAKAAIT